jgi:hypothetical protein
VAAERGEAGERAPAISLLGVTAFVQHRVKDYDAWCRVYASVADMQKAGGVVAESVYRAESDPNIVMVSHQFSSISAAHEFFDTMHLARQCGGRVWKRRRCGLSSSRMLNLDLPPEVLREPRTVRRST